MGTSSDPGGLTCAEAMELLSAYVDGELEPERLGAVERHVHGCATCEHVGGRYAAVVRCMRARAASAEPLDGDVAARLDQCLRKNLGEG